MNVLEEDKSNVVQKYNVDDYCFSEFLEEDASRTLMNREDTNGFT